MNLTNFLKEIDSLTEQYSKEQLSSFIHDIGRGLPEQNREDFLKRLKTIGTDTKKSVKKCKNQSSVFDTTYQEVKENLKKIDSQEITITSTLNEEYDDWYDSMDEEFIYEDENGVSDMLAQACDFVHTCMDEERYKEGLEIGRKLFFMEIFCENEYDDEVLSIGDMVYHELLFCSMKKVLLDTLYCAYHATPLKNRAEVLYEILENSKMTEITLESMMQHGDEELPDFSDFLTTWIIYLGNTPSVRAGKLFSEAVCLLNDVSFACTYAEKFVSNHPGIYLNIMDNEKSADFNAMISIGRKAMECIPKKYIVRSMVALKTADYVIKSKEQQNLLEQCYFAAFQSDTSVVNYLRALFHGYGTERKREEIRTVFMSKPMEKYSLSNGQRSYEYLSYGREENKPDRNTLLMLRFFDGQFEEVLTKGLNEQEALGWTDTFMKQGIALFLLALYEGEWKSRGILEMADIVNNRMGFSIEEYQKGLLKKSYTNEFSLFYDLFSEWKSMLKMEAELKIKVMKKIEELIEKRTDGIMQVNRRNYYGECAAYIAALGEVQESLGEQGAKQRLMTSYKDKYTRRSAFRAEMQCYGWIDVKKK